MLGKTTAVPQTVQNVRASLASRWQGLFSLALGLPVLWDVISRAGIPVPPLSKFPIWLLVLVYGLALVIARYPRIAIFVSRLILGPAPPTSEPAAIFRGPRAYNESDANLLPGRRHDAQHCQSLVELSRFFIIEGESGCGKSSFVRAGLFAGMRRKHLLTEIIIRNQSVDSIIDLIRSRTPTVSFESSDPNRGAVSNKPPCVILDQFEQIFLSARDLDRIRLMSAMRDEVLHNSLHVVVVIRTDFLDLLLKSCREVDPKQDAFDLGCYYTLSAFDRDRAVKVLSMIMKPVIDAEPERKYDIENLAEVVTDQLLRSPRDRRLSPDDQKTVLPVEMQIIGLLLERHGLSNMSKGAFVALGGKIGLLREYVREATDYVWRKTGVSGDQSLLVLRSLVSEFTTKKLSDVKSISQTTSIPINILIAVLDAYAERYLVKRVQSIDVDVGEYELMHDHVAYILAESPDPTLQRIKAAQDRIRFWREHVRRYFSDLPPVGQTWSSWTQRLPRQHIPLAECLWLLRYAVSRDDKRMFYRNIFAFSSKSVAALFLILLPATLVAREFIQPKGFVILSTGEASYNDSGFNFRTGRKVAWNSREADLLASRAHDSGWETARLFVQQESGRFAGEQQDRGSHSGLLHLVDILYENVTKCPSEGYRGHYYPPDPEENGFPSEILTGDIFCVRTRDGRTYAKIKIDIVEKDRLGFYWTYQTISYLPFF